jgi:hypothetical protein
MGKSMDVRDCENCAYHTEEGCCKWECEFKRKMTSESREKVYRACIATYGKESQIDMAIEEMSELIKALLKLRRYGSSDSWMQYQADVHEEMADVKIMLRQLELIFGCEESVEEWIDQKIERQMERLADVNL